MKRGRRGRTIHRLARVLLVVLAGAASARCAHSPATPRQRLSPDSAEALERALRLVRPAYATQEEAVRAGVYAATAANPPAGLPAAPLPAAAPAGTPAGTPAADGEALPFVVQVAAFRDAASAWLAVRDASRRFPDLRAEVLAEGSLRRVSLIGWPDSLAAVRALPSIRAVFPSAWVRRRPLP